MLSGDLLSAHIEMVKSMTGYAPIDMFSLRRNIAAHIKEKENYAC